MAGGPIYRPRNVLSDDQYAAATGAADPNSGNVFATIDDLPAAPDLTDLNAHIALIDAANPHGTTWNEVGAQPFHGFESRSDNTMAFDNDTHIFTLTKDSGNFFVWVEGVRYECDSTATPFTIDLDTGGAIPLGLTYIWLYLSGGHLELNMTKGSPWNILNLKNAPVAIIHWDGTSGIIMDERHDYRRNLLEHLRVHTTQGASYVSGFGNGSFLAANSFSFDAGQFRDEDILHDLTGSRTSCRIGYRATGGATMQFDAVGNTFAKLDGSSHSYFDSAGTLTLINENNYGLYWIYATNHQDQKVISIVGQAQYTTSALALAAPQPTLAGLSTAEYKLLYRVLVRRNDSAPGTTGPFLVIQADAMYNLSTGPAILASAPSVVSAGAVTFTPTADVNESNVQSAIENVSDEVQGAISDLSTHTHSQLDRIVAVFDGGGSAIAADKKVYVYVPFACTITDWTIIANISGSITIDVWKVAYANHPPTVANTITNSNKMVLTSAIKAQDLSVANWAANPQTISAGDILCFNVDALATSVTWCAAILTVTRT